MKESKLVEMRNQIDTLGKVCMKMTQDIQKLNMIVMGDHEVIKRLPEFDGIIKQMQDEQEKNTAGAATGDSGSLETNE